MIEANPSALQYKEIADKMERESAQEVLKWALDTYAPRIALASSFGAEDIVLIDMMTRIDKEKTKVFILDTGRLNQETYNVVDDIRKKYNIQIEAYFPAQEEVEEMVR
ncbi:MAG TPA: phosphoadenosine phosphosulfate reductase family protein, partial [Nitrososphaeraceae archaeon]|nr:phosphoadenosine phosphosulfate reductase family protein [Nitrososphaeraceae archaeon]